MLGFPRSIASGKDTKYLDLEPRNDIAKKRGTSHFGKDSKDAPSSKNDQKAVPPRIH